MWAGNLPREKYSTPIHETKIDSVTIYYYNENIAKKITSETDISVVVDALNGLSLGETYEIDENLYDMLEIGGLSFCFIFYLEDGTEWICTYYQTNSDGEGRFADGQIRRKVSNLKVLELWQSLSYPEIKDFSIEEFTVPVLF